MKFHFYGQRDFAELLESTTVGDLQSLTFFNRVSRNYFKIDKLENDNIRNNRKI